MAEINDNKTFGFCTAMDYVVNRGKSVRCLSWKKDVFCRLGSAGMLRRYSARSGRAELITVFVLFASDLIGEWELYNA